MKCSLIITTYNWPEALDLVLLSVQNQTLIPDEVIIAHDGSSQSTKEVIENFSNNSHILTIHSWQNDKGFRLSKSRNRAIAKAKSEYIIVIDGDMILHRDFVKDHIKSAQKNTYIQGSRVLLQQTFSNKILTNKLFKKPHFFSNEAKNKINLFRFPLLSFFILSIKNQKLNRIRGCNFSLFKEDIIKVNGFNEEFISWGKEDSEFVQRLFNHGIYRKNLKFSGIQYHLFHNEGSSNSDNIQLLNESIEKKYISCKDGIEKYL